jgi:hypothetical protein
MTVRIRTITFDCRDAYLLAGFWSQVTGFGEDPDNPNHPDDPEGVLLAPDRYLALLFADQRDDEVRRILALGAALVADHRKPDGTGWVVLADPEGNEFCVERGVTGD